MSKATYRVYTVAVGDQSMTTNEVVTALADLKRLLSRAPVGTVITLTIGRDLRHIYNRRDEFNGW